MAKKYIELEKAIEALVGLTTYDNAPALNAAVEKEYHNGREWIGGVRDALIEIGDLPAADVVEMPCRIGDTVWCIRSFKGIDHPQETKVSGMYFTQDMRLNIQCKYVGIGEFGKKVFKTREDAMKAMEGQRA